jgi:hypothetical protein
MIMILSAWKGILWYSSGHLHQYLFHVKKKIEKVNKIFHHFLTQNATSCSSNFCVFVISPRMIFINYLVLTIILFCAIYKTLNVKLFSKIRKEMIPIQYPKYLQHNWTTKGPISMKTWKVGMFRSVVTCWESNVLQNTVFYMNFSFSCIFNYLGIFYRSVMPFITPLPPGCHLRIS